MRRNEAVIQKTCLAEDWTAFLFDSVFEKTADPNKPLSVTWLPHDQTLLLSVHLQQFHVNIVQLEPSPFYASIHKDRHAASDIANQTVSDTQNAKLIESREGASEPPSGGRSMLRDDPRKTFTSDTTANHLNNLQKVHKLFF